ncbi:MAG: sodium:solute symporter family protein [Candidatus Marinimicrobia bacterium]|nr:sodium:solute symporter family protein [Candidatus Neomarinimicrobiota bacterium]
MEKIELSIWDFSVIVLYFVILGYIGIKSGKKTRNDAEDYLLASRKLTLPAFVATLVSTWYGGILGIGEFIYNYGILNWFAMGLPYYIFAIIFAFFLAGRIRNKNQFTIPDLLYNEYGKVPGLIGSVLVFILVTPAPYYLMIGYILSVILGLPFWISFFIGAIASTFYLFRGGFKSVVSTDILQFILMFLGFLILFSICVIKLGGFEYLKGNLPDTHLEPLGGQRFSFLVVWFFIAMWTIVDPAFYQRCYSAINQKTAKNGMLVSVLFWMIFDFLTLSVGLYARANLEGINPTLSFIILSDKLLPPFLKGLFFVAIFATIMSTMDSLSFLSSMTFARDIIWRNSKNSDESKVNNYTRFGIILTIGLSTVLVMFFPSVVSIWYVVGSIVIPSLLVSVLDAIFDRKLLNTKTSGLILVIPFIANLFWIVYGYANASNGSPSYLFGVEPFFVGIVLAGIIIVINILVQKRT